MLPIALMRVQAAPKWPLLSPYKMMYRRPFLTSDFFFFFNEDTNELLRHTIDLGRFQQELRYGERSS